MGQQQIAQNEKAREESNQTGVRLTLIVCSAILLVIVTFLLVIHLGSSDESAGKSIFSYSKADLGTLGDLLGGTLNPILSFATICLLVWSIQIQIKELSETREELRKTNEHHSQNLKEQKRHFQTEQLLKNLDVLETEHFKILNSVIGYPGLWSVHGLKQHEKLTVAEAIDRHDIWKRFGRDTQIRLQRGISSLANNVIACNSIYNQLLEAKVPHEFYAYRLSNLVHDTIEPLDLLDNFLIDKGESLNFGSLLDDLVTLYDELYGLFSENNDWAIQTIPQTQTKPD